eukprot:2387439-Rhodomonas_salina.2
MTYFGIWCGYPSLWVIHEAKIISDSVRARPDSHKADLAAASPMIAFQSPEHRRKLGDATRSPFAIRITEKA